MPLLTYARTGIQNEQERNHLLHLVSVILPKYHRDTMEVLFVYFKWVASFAHVDEDTGSKMDLQNLATVITPNILYSKGRDPTRDESFTAIRVVRQLLELQDEFYAVPDEFISVLQDQEYFANALDMQGKDLLKKCDTYRRVKQNGAGRPLLNGPLMSTSNSNGSLASQRTDGSDVRLIQSQRSEPNIQRGRPTGAPVQNGYHGASSRGGPISHSQERPAPMHTVTEREMMGGTLPSRPGPPHPGLTHQPFSMPSAGMTNSPLQQRAPETPWGPPPSRPLSYVRQSDEMLRQPGTSSNGHHSPSL